MKKYILLVCTFLICISFCACSNEKSETNSTSVIRTVGDSEIFTEAEINEAMDAMILAFQDYAEDYLNPTLTEVIYNEETSLSMLQEGSSFLANVSNIQGKAMVITTVHSIEETASEPNLIAAKDDLYHHWLLTYDNEKWIVTEPNAVSTMGIGIKEH